MIKKIALKVIFWLLYIPFLWIFIEGSSFVGLYAYYTILDKKDLTTKKVLPTLRHFKKHPLFVPTKHYKPNHFDAFVGHRFAQSGEYYGLGVNPYGFIHNGDSMRPPFADDNKIKIVLLGGSSMAGFGAEVNQATIASYLERQLNNNNKNKEYEVLNAGKDSYYSPVQLSYFTIELLNYKPDFVVALDGFNDYWHSNSLNPESASYEGWAIPQRSMYQRSIEDFINTPSIGSLLRAAIKDDTFKTVFYYSLKLVSGVHPTRYRTRDKKVKKPVQGRSIWVDNAIYIRDKINHTKSHIPFMERNWRSLIGAAIANNVKPILLLQPVLPVTEKKMTPSETEFYYMEKWYKYYTVEDYEKNVRGFFKEASEMVKRVKKSFPNSEQAIIEDISKMFKDVHEDVFVDFVHYNYRGNCKIAAFIASQIRKNRSEFADPQCNQRFYLPK